MASETEICNLAMRHLGTGKTISILTENTEEANACRAFYEVAKKSTLRDFNWPFAKVFAELNLIEEDPTSEWAYAYRYPVDCLRVRRFISGRNPETNQSRIPYSLGSDNAGKIIYSNFSLAEIEYTKNINIPALHDADFDLALSFRIAAYTAASLTKGDPTKIKGDMIALYKAELNTARQNASNEEQNYNEVESTLIRKRSE